MSEARAFSALGPSEEQQLQEIVDGLQQLYPRELIAIFLYGSAARGDFIPGRSDLNLLIVLHSLGLDDLDRVAKVFRRWKRLRIAPLLLTAGELHLASRVFPLELLEIKESGRLLYGSNPLATLRIEPDQFRAQCRREACGTLIRLRQEYLRLADRQEALGSILSGAVTSLLAVFRGVLRLSGSPVPIPDAAVVEAVAARHHLDRDLFAALLAHKQGSRRLATADFERLLGRLIIEWDRLIALIDAV